MDAFHVDPWLWGVAATPVMKNHPKSHTPTSVYVTIDTEYEPGFTARAGPDSRDSNFSRSILGETAEGAFGIGYQLDRFEQHGLKAVFFVDPMPALLWGVEAIADVVGPIVERGQDVQLHLHTEWLALAGAANPLGAITGANLKDFTFEDQCRLIDCARALLVAAGAPPPVAFRAGNFGANDDTLRALAELGISYDTSHSPGFAASPCAIGLDPALMLPSRHCGVVEVPVGCIADLVKGTQHAQLTALSKAELLAAIRHARDSGMPGFTIVSHSFELLSRDRSRVNKVVRRRFDAFCAGLATMRGVRTATYASDPPSVGQAEETTELMPQSVLRAGLRAAEQVVSNALYDDQQSQQQQ